LTKQIRQSGIQTQLPKSAESKRQKSMQEKKKGRSPYLESRIRKIDPAKKGRMKAGHQISRRFRYLLHERRNKKKKPTIVDGSADSAGVMSQALPK